MRHLKGTNVKKFIANMLAIVISLSIVSADLQTASAASTGYSTLGTATAMGSPLINKTYTAESWNKWELYVWGIFLSNFATPLMDDYQSAFTTGHGGSDGGGFKALQFAVGGDKTSSDIIEEFCNYAIQQQLTNAKQLYVTFTPCDSNGVGTQIDPNNPDDATDFIRQATFDDMWIEFNSSASVSTDAVKYQVSETGSSGYTVYSNGVVSAESNGTYHDSSYFTGYIPTFWIKSGTEYVKILDYTNSWDVQIPSLVISKIGESDFDGFVNAFDSYYSSNSQILLDSYGNIITSDGKIIVPASANQNLTETRKINLVNSYVLNQNTSNDSASKIVTQAEQFLNSPWFQSGDTYVGNLPALQGEDSKLNEGTVYVYYDLDSIYYEQGKNDDYGELVKTLFSCDINAKNQLSTLHAETLQHLSLDWTGSISGSSIDTIAESTFSAQVIANIQGNNSDADILNKITLTDGSELNLFGDPVVTCVGIDTEDENMDDYGLTRRFFDFLYKAYSGKITDTTKGNAQSAIRRVLENTDTAEDFIDELENENGGYFSSYIGSQYSGDIADLEDLSFKEGDWEDTSRLIMVYPTSDTMLSVANALGVVEGTEFSIYSTYIYVTYLEFYELSGSGANATSALNKKIFTEGTDLDNFDPSDIINFKSEADMKKEVLQNAYLLLSPADGRAYRSQLINSAFEDFLYEHYTRMVYGGSSESIASTTVGTSTNSGFFKIFTFEENPFTAFFIKGYATIAVWLIMGCLIFMIIFGLLKGRKPMWFLATAFMIINVILITPATGELTAFISSHIIDGMFNSKITYWSMAEGITNAELEAEYASTRMNSSDLSDEEAQMVLSLIKQLNVLYTDKTLMIKKDISTKTVQETNGIYADIQNYASARWLLPTIMQQYSDDNSNDYLYSSLGNLYDDTSNAYWFFDPIDAANITAVAPTATSNQDADDIGDSRSTVFGTNIKGGAYINYTSLLEHDNQDSLNVDGLSYQSKAYDVNSTTEDKLIHTYSYVCMTGKSSSLSYLDMTSNSVINLATSSATGSANSSLDVDSLYDNYTGSITKTALTDMVDAIELHADSYSRTDRDTFDPIDSYLWATETPYSFFYGNVKESFKDGETVGSIIGQLQGQYSTDKYGNEVRSSFMHADDSSGNCTGYVRDICDLQGLFTNEVPYMYEVWVAAESQLEGETISSEYSLYEGNPQSWFFRSNWVIKLVESPEYNKASTVKSADGTRYTVANMILPQCYPAERPMVFSEAQKEAYGLSDSDLNVAELKCIECNKEVERSWTELINFAGTSGVTVEVLERQMAISCLTTFDKVFSPSGVFNSSYAMYPRSIDLRNVSFDSVMKMLVISSNTGHSYNLTNSYSNTMKAFIAESDMLNAVLLLIIAFLCSYLVTFLRNVLMALIFYLGYVAIIHSITANNKFKIKVACGQFLCNILFLIMTTIYFLLFRLMLSMDTADQVLSTSSWEMNMGNVTWKLIVILLATVVYLYLMVKEIIFCIKHYDTMGAEILMETVRSIKTRIVGGFDGVRNAFSSRGEDEASINNARNTQSIKESLDEFKHAMQEVGNISLVDDNQGSSIGTVTKRKSTENKNSDVDSSSYEVEKNDRITSDENIASDIDSSIDQGKSDMNNDFDTDGMDSSTESGKK